jgi:transcriptional regulator with XRE-family HTH domain
VQTIFLRMNLKLLVARRQRDWSQLELAEKAGINQADISRIEKGGWTPPPDIQQKLATALETTTEELFSQSAESLA